MHRGLPYGRLGILDIQEDPVVAIRPGEADLQRPALDVFPRKIQAHIGRLGQGEGVHRLVGVTALRKLQLGDGLVVPSAPR